jgi:large subunit ribosomal protein L24
MQKRRYEESLKWGGEPEYPIVVDDAKYFHIVKDDRVVIMRGRERGKIGKVQSVMARTHEVLVEGLNKVFRTYSDFMQQLILPVPH